MGYLAYAGCTLIFAWTAHALYSKVLNRSHDQQEQIKYEDTPTLAKGESSTQVHRSEAVTSPVAITVGMHDEVEEIKKPEGAKSPVEVVGTTEQCPPSSGKPSLMPPPTAPAPPQFRLKAPTSTSMRDLAQAVPAKGNSLLPSKNGSTSLMPPPSAASSLRVPTQQVLTNTKMQPASTSTLAPSKRSSRKVILSPGHSPLDWAALTRASDETTLQRLKGSSAYERYGPYKLARITPSRLKAHTGRKGKDAWTSYQGKVYNLTAYLKFHPGGESELMKGAGRDSGQLFNEVHPWVNWDGMLQSCLIGRLVDESDGEAQAEQSAYDAWLNANSTVNVDDMPNQLDEMD